MILPSLFSTGSDCYSLEKRRCCVQLNLEYRFDAACTGAEPRNSGYLSWVESLQLLVVIAGQQEEEFRPLGVYQGQVVACLLIHLIFASIDLLGQFGELI